jgi:hypothetical protein
MRKIPLAIAAAVSLVATGSLIPSRDGNDQYVGLSNFT